MTTRTDLFDMIASGESSGVEFKRDDISTQDFARELVAFSNADGGVVLLGVADDGSIAGLTRPDLEQWVMNECRDKVRPGILPYFEVLREVEAGKDVAVVRATRGYDVHALWHNESSKYLIRVGSQSREASREELGRLFQRRGAIRTEMLSISGGTLESLDRRRLRNYFSDIRRQPVPADDDEGEWQSLLMNTGFMADDAVSIGGMLLFGSMPNRSLPHAGIDAVAYYGTAQDYEAQERAALQGPMTPLRASDRATVENGLVEQAVGFVQRNARGTAKLEGGRRIDRPAYPEEVVRESVVNALIHRDYLFTSTNIQLELFSDRLEIVSPGRLPNGITPERMRLGTRATRNELLKNVMRDYGYLESMGMGIPRKVVKGMRKHNDTEPELVEQDERFIVRLLA